MVRTDGKDADALGKEPPKQETPTTREGDVDVMQAVQNALESAYDPEIPVDIVDLGLVYGCEVKEAGGGKKVEAEEDSGPLDGVGARARRSPLSRRRHRPGYQTAKGSHTGTNGSPC